MNKFHKGIINGLILSAKSTPFLTLTKAKGSYANGDTIYVNNGTYTEAKLKFLYGGYLLPLQDYAVTIKSTATDTPIWADITPPQVFTIGRFLIDSSNGPATYCIQIQSYGAGEPNPTIVLNQTKMTGCTLHQRWRGCGDDNGL